MTIGVVLNTGKRQAYALVNDTVDKLCSMGFDVAMERDSASFLNTGGGEALEALLTRADVLMVFGGDGTILSAASAAAAAGVPVLGVNLGRLGFLSELESLELDAYMERLQDGRYFVEERMMLQATVDAGGSTRPACHALNDFVLSRRGHHIARLAVSVGGQPLGSYAADGVVIATPTGSTAYSLSAGGPIVSPLMRCMLISPICAHTLSARPMVVAPEDYIEVTVLPPGDGVDFSGDGVPHGALGEGARVRVERSVHDARFIRFEKRNFYALLNSKLADWR